MPPKGKVSIVEVHVRVDKSAEARLKKLSQRFRERALAALADANVEIMQRALVASSVRLNARMRKSRAGGRAAPGEVYRAGGKRGLRWLLQQNDPIGKPADSILKASYRGWAHGGVIGNPEAIVRAGVQFYWRAVDRGSSAQVGREMKGFMLDRGGAPLGRGRGGVWAEGRLGVNARKTGAFNAVTNGRAPKFTIKNPIPDYQYLEAAQNKLQKMVDSGETVEIYQKHFDRHGLGQLNLRKHGVGSLLSLQRARTITLVARR